MVFNVFFTINFGIFPEISLSQLEKMLGNGWMFLEIHPSPHHQWPQSSTSPGLRTSEIPDYPAGVAEVPAGSRGTWTPRWGPGGPWFKRKQNGLSENWVPQSFDGLSSQFSLLFGGILRQKVEGLVRIFQKTLASGTAKKLPIEKPQC